MGGSSTLPIDLSRFFFCPDKHTLWQRRGEHMKTKFWNGSFLRTVLQCLAIACAALLALSALGAGLVLGGVVDQKQIPAAACCICFAAVFLGSFLAAKHTAGKRLPAALAVAGCCFAVCFLARLTAFGNTQAHMLTPAVCMLAAALLAGILGGTRKKSARRRRR